MLVGYIGTIAADLIEERAADIDDPDAVTDVVVYVDGKRVAREPCDIFRSDLRDMKIFGHGNHGLHRLPGRALSFHTGRGERRYSNAAERPWGLDSCW
jgi:hypothetical protein